MSTDPELAIDRRHADFPSAHLTLATTLAVSEPRHRPCTRTRTRDHRALSRHNVAQVRRARCVCRACRRERWGRGEVLHVTNAPLFLQVGIRSVDPGAPALACCDDHSDKQKKRERKVEALSASPPFPSDGVPYLPISATRCPCCFEIEEPVLLPPIETDGTHHNYVCSGNIRKRTFTREHSQ